MQLLQLLSLSQKQRKPLLLQLSLRPQLQMPLLPPMLLRLQLQMPLPLQKSRKLFKLKMLLILPKSNNQRHQLQTPLLLQKLRKLMLITQPQPQRLPLQNSRAISSTSTKPRTTMMTPNNLLPPRKRTHLQLPPNLLINSSEFKITSQWLKPLYKNIKSTLPIFRNYCQHLRVLARKKSKSRLFRRKVLLRTFLHMWRRPIVSIRLRRVNKRKSKQRKPRKKQNKRKSKPRRKPRSRLRKQLPPKPRKSRLRNRKSSRPRSKKKLRYRRRSNSSKRNSKLTNKLKKRGLLPRKQKLMSNHQSNMPNNKKKKPCKNSNLPMPPCKRRQTRSWRRLLPNSMASIFKNSLARTMSFGKRSTRKHLQTMNHRWTRLRVSTKKSSQIRASYSSKRLSHWQISIRHSWRVPWRIINISKLSMKLTSKIYSKILELLSLLRSLDTSSNSGKRTKLRRKERRSQLPWPMPPNSGSAMERKSKFESSLPNI